MQCWDPNGNTWFEKPLAIVFDPYAETSSWISRPLLDCLGNPHIVEAISAPVFRDAPNQKVQADGKVNIRFQVDSGRRSIPCECFVFQPTNTFMVDLIIGRAFTNENQIMEQGVNLCTPILDPTPRPSPSKCTDSSSIAFFSVALQF